MDTRLLIALLVVAAVIAVVVYRRMSEGGPATAGAGEPGALGKSINVATAHSLLGNPDVFLLDVREPGEYAAVHIPGSTLIPMGQIGRRLDEIPTDRAVIVACRSGMRSGQVCRVLRSHGYNNIHNMKGGMNAWRKAGFPVE